MNVQTPRFDWSFNFGHVLTSISVILAMGGGVLAFGQKLENIDQRITTVERHTIETRPKVEALMRSDALQDDRIQNLTDSIKGIRADNAEVNKKMGSIGESMVGMKAQLDTLVRRN